MNAQTNPIEQKSYIYEAVVNKSTYIAENVGDGIVKISVKMPRKRRWECISHYRAHDGKSEAHIASEIRYHQLKLKYGRKSTNFGLLTPVQRAQFAIREPSAGFFVVPIEFGDDAQHAVLDALAALDAAQ